MHKNYLHLLIAGFDQIHEETLTKLLAEINESKLGIELRYQTATHHDEIVKLLSESFYKVCLVDYNIDQKIHPRFLDEIQTRLHIQNKYTAIININTKESIDQDLASESNIVPLYSPKCSSTLVNIGELNNYWLAFIIKAACERIQLKKEIKRLTHYDSLTGLVSRNLYLNHLHHALNLADKEQRFCTLIYLDINNFKQLNEEYSHKIGDDILIESAQRIKKTIRSVDIAARLGSDEFAVLLENCSPKEAARIILDLKQAMSLPYCINSHKLNVEFSIDNACYPDQSSDKGSFLNNVRQAHYLAKST